MADEITFEALRKATADEVREIKRGLDDGVYQAVLARTYSVSPRTIYAIKKGVIWATI